MSELNTPRTLGNYELLEQVGAGSTGIVYRAKNRTSGETVAVKVIGQPLNDELAARLRGEVEAASELRSPYIARLIEVGFDQSRYFLVSEFVDGLSLATLVARGPVSPVVALTVSQQVAMALQAASSDGLIHRDLKPQNILLAEDGTAKLAGFGEASLVFAGTELQSLDTAAYAAPEQFAGAPTIRSDIYSLGAIMFEMLTGHRPFDGDSVSALVPMHLGRQPALEELPTAFRTVVGRCLAKAEAGRYQSPADLVAALQTVREQLPTASAGTATGGVAPQVPPASQASPAPKPATARPARDSSSRAEGTPATDDVRFAPQPRRRGLSRSRVLASVGAVAGLIVLVVAVLASGVLASKPAKPQFPTDSKTADSLAHNAMMPVSALPGSDWKITNLDPAEPDKPAVETDSCKPINDNQSDTKAFDDKHRAARAKEEITHPVAKVPLPTTVDVEVDIYKQTSGLQDHLKTVRKLTDSGTYIKCFSDLIDNAFKNTSFKATTKTVDPTMPAPENGFVFAAESQVTGLDTPLRFENYGWITSNAKVTVSFSGSKDQITPDLVKAAIEKTQSSLANARP